MYIRWLLVLFLFKTRPAPCRSSSIDCTFEYNLCGWASEPPWLLTDRTFLPSPFNLNPIILVGDNTFMTAQGRFGSNSTADLVSPLIPPSSTLSILSFKYTKIIGDADLQIMIKEGATYRNLDTITTNVLVFWIRRTIVVPITLEPYQIVFRASRLRTGFDVISIDDVMLRTSTKMVESDGDEMKFGLTEPLEPRETRRSPTSYRNWNRNNQQRITTYCSLVKCSFKSNSCFWSFDNWKLLNGKIVSENQPEAWLRTEPVLLPMNAHFELDVLSSDSAIIYVYQQFGGEKILIWTQSGLTLIGWNRIRLPIRFSPLPSKLLLKTSTSYGHFVAVTNTNIVDESGRDLACGGDMLVIRPKNENLIRLTAMQKIDSHQVESSSIPTLFMVSPSTVAAPSISAPTMNSFSVLSRTNVAPTSSATLPISPAQVFANQHLIKSNHAHRARAFSVASINNNTKITSKSSLLDSQTLPLPIVSVTDSTPSIEKLLASLNVQPTFDGQLKYLAKKFGIDRIPGDQIVQRYDVIRRMVEALQRNKSTADKQLISPTNTKEVDSSPLPEEMSKLTSSILPSSRALNNALTSKISQLLSPPPHHGDDSKPFSRNNMDFVIENAYNAYVNQEKSRIS